MSTKVRRVYGYLAEFKNASQLYKAAEKVRDAGFKKWDCYTPYPVHGLDDAMGVKRSILPYFVFVGGLTGFITAIILAYGTQVGLYPTIVQGKPANIHTISAFFPVMFELTILFAALTCVFGMFGMNGLPRLHHPLLANDRFRRVTDDRFYIVIEARDPKFFRSRTEAFLGSIGAVAVEEVQD